MFCREWLAQLERHHKDIMASGLRVVAVGLGEPKHARRYCGKLAPSATCYTTSTGEVNRAYGLARAGLRQLAMLDMAKAVVRAISRGHMQGRTTGDALMLPGTFIIDRDGIVRYAYYSRHAGDHPDLTALLQAGSVK